MNRLKKWGGGCALKGMGKQFLQFNSGYLIQVTDRLVVVAELHVAWINCAQSPPPLLLLSTGTPNPVTNDQSQLHALTYVVAKIFRRKSLGHVDRLNKYNTLMAFVISIVSVRRCCSSAINRTKCFTIVWQTHKVN